MLLEAGTQNGAGQEPQLLTGCTDQQNQNASMKTNYDSPTDSPILQK